MLRIEGREFRSQTKYPLPDLEDVELRRCTFVECQWPAEQTLEDRPTVRRVNLTVLVAPRRNKHFERELAALERLPALGVAMPD